MWYNRFQGAKCAEIEIKGGDMHVRFAGIYYGGRGRILDKEIRNEWFAKIDQHPDE